MKIRTIKEKIIFDELRDTSEKWMETTRKRTERRKRLFQEVREEERFKYLIKFYRRLK